MTTELFITTPRAGTVSVDYGTGPNYLIGVGTNFTVTDEGKPIIIRTTSGDIRSVILTFIDETHIKIADILSFTQTDCFFYIDYASVDLAEDIPFPLTYKIADVREPDKRDSSRSLTLHIPGTKSNNIIFDHIYQIDLEGSFNPNIRAFIIIYQDYIPIFKGNLQLLKINRDGDKIEYECAAFGKIGDLFQKVADKLLTDLDLSDLDEIGTATDITNSWAGGGDLFYPLLNNGRQNLANTTPQYLSDQIAPAIRWSTIFERILSSVGYSNPVYATLYAETGMDKLYVPCLKEWRRRVFINFGLRGNYTTGGTGNTGDVYLVIDRIRTGTTESIFTGTTVTDSVANISYQTTIELDWGDIVHFDIVPDIANVADSFTEVDNVNTYLQITYLDLQFNYNENGYNSLDLAGNVIIPGAGTATKKITYNNEISDPNNTWATNIHTVPEKYTQGFLPDNYKQRDFLLATIKMFNLYLEPVTDNDSQIVILPRDTYYDNLNVVDWTEKLDVGQNIELIPMGELDWKQYLFSWKEDGDFWNKDYQSKYDKIYGQRIVTVENDFITNNKKVELEIAPFPLLKTPYNDLVLPCCIKDGVSTIPNQFAGILRLIYFDGTMVTTGGINTVYLDGVSHGTYPFCGHLVGTPQVPTFDYNWAAPLQVYYPMDDITLYPYQDNLYTAFWQNNINEISDKYSKLLIAYFRLTAEDIRTLDFSAKYFIDGTYFRLNKVIDYDPVNEKLTKCELLRINEAVYAAQVVSDGNTGVGSGTETSSPYVGAAADPGFVLVSDSYGNVIAQEATGDITIDDSARVTVTGLRGIAIDTAIPTNGQVYVYNSGSAKWEPQTPSGGSFDPTTITGWDANNPDMILQPVGDGSSNLIWRQSA